MIFDDHDVIDDWNTSPTGSRRCAPALVGRADRQLPDRRTGCYQHLGNLSPEEPRRGRVLPAVARRRRRRRRSCATSPSAPTAEAAGARWSYRRDFGRVRLVMVDSRAARVLEQGARSMVDAEEWHCIVEWTRGDFDHLLIGTSLPGCLGRGMHDVEAWNEAVAAARGAGGRRPASACARRLDLEHWAAFGDSCGPSSGCSPTSPRAGTAAPGDVVLLSGDVHHAYVADARPAEGEPAWESPVYQAVCSPLRNPLDSNEKRAIKMAMTSGAELVGRALARAAGVEGEPLTWEIANGPWFDNQVGTLELDGRRCTFRLDKALGAGNEQPRLEEVAVRRLA